MFVCDGLKFNPHTYISGWGCLFLLWNIRLVLPRTTLWAFKGSCHWVWEITTRRDPSADLPIFLAKNSQCVGSDKNTIRDGGSTALYTAYTALLTLFTLLTVGKTNPNWLLAIGMRLPSSIPALLHHVDEKESVAGQFDCKSSGKRYNDNCLVCEQASWLLRCRQ